MYDNTSLTINEGSETLKESKNERVSYKRWHDRTERHTRHNDELVHKQKARIEDLKTQIQTLFYDQLKEVTQKQAVHIKSLIQENSKLNTKLLEEVLEKKTWCRFW